MSFSYFEPPKKELFLENRSPSFFLSSPSLSTGPQHSPSCLLLVTINNFLAEEISSSCFVGVSLQNLS